MLLSNIFANRLIGHDFSLEYPKLNKYKRGIVPALIFVDTLLFGWATALILTLGFILWRYPGWGEIFIAMHGDELHYKNRDTDKLDIIIADFLYTPKDTEGRKRWGVVYGAVRGLYDLPTFAALAVLYASPAALLLGFGMALLGLVYYLTPKLFSEDTAHAEYLGGALRGALLLTSLLLATSML